MAESVFDCLNHSTMSVGSEPYGWSPDEVVVYPEVVSIHDLNWVDVHSGSGYTVSPCGDSECVEECPKAVSWVNDECPDASLGHGNMSPVKGDSE